MNALNWENAAYTLKKSNDSDEYELIVMLNEDSEFGSEIIDFLKKSKNIALQKFVNKKFPNKKITAVKIMTGGILICSLMITPAISPFFSSYTVEASEVINSTIKIRFGNCVLSSDTDPININGRLFLPIRAIAETLGANVEWNETTREVTVKKDANTIKLKINDPTGYVNGVQKQMDASPIINNARTMVPLRFIAEALNISVEYNEAERTAFINKEKSYDLYYSVLAGDTVAKIASKFNIPAQSIREWNNIKNDFIMAGQFLRVASPALKPDTSIDVFKDMQIQQYSFNVVQGYTVKDYPTQTSSLTSFNNNIEKVSTASTFTHKVNSDGTLTVAYDQNDIVSAAVNSGKKVNMLVHNADTGGFNKSLGKAVLSGKEMRTKLINNIVSEVKKVGYTGVEIDFESLPSESRDDFSSFLAELNTKLKEDGYALTVAVPAKSSDNKTDWLGAYDYAEIGKNVDYVMLMTYDQHWSGGTPGPIASVDWVESILKYAVSVIPSQKVIMGVAAYGYDWKEGSGSSVSILESGVNKLVSKYGGAIQWNDSSKTPYYAYTDDKNVSRIVWFENVHSAQFKLALAKKYDVAGIGIWRMGLESGNFWSALQ